MNSQNNESKNLNVGIILPTFNVEKVVQKTLAEIMPLLDNTQNQLLIIDNCSTDKTLQVIREFVAEKFQSHFNVNFRLHQKNYGYGASIKAGFDFFKKEKITHILVLHSDSQTNNTLLFKGLTQASLTNDAGVVLGSRFLATSQISKYSRFRTWANQVFNLITRISTGKHLSDWGTAMILIKREMLDHVNIKKLPDDWKFHPALNVLLVANKSAHIQEFPMKWSDSKARSSVPLIKYGFSLFWMLSKVFVYRILGSRDYSNAVLQPVGVTQLNFELLNLKSFVDRINTRIG